MPWGHLVLPTCSGQWGPQYDTDELSRQGAWGRKPLSIQTKIMVADGTWVSNVLKGKEEGQGGSRQGDVEVKGEKTVSEGRWEGRRRKIQIVSIGSPGNLEAYNKTTLSINRWRGKEEPLWFKYIMGMWFRYIMEHYSALKKNNENLPFEATWMDLEGLMLSEISWQRQILDDITYMWNTMQKQYNTIQKHTIKWRLNKRKQTHRPREQTSDHQWGEGKA